MFNKSFLKKNLTPFLEIYKNRPIKNNQSGMKIDHCFALFCFLNKIKPDYIIESGVWKGQTTWLIKRVLKKSKIFSIDIDLSNREVIYDDVKYLNKDISKYNWKKLNKNKTVIIFDDHVCFSKRLDFIKKNKFKHIIFDDNLPNHHISYYTPKMIYERQYLIKKEFIKYSNIYRLIKFVIRYFKNEFKGNIKLNFNYKFIKITYPENISEELNKKFLSIRKKIKIYYEFPPLKKFNYRNRFKKILKNFDEEIPKTYKVQKPIFNKNEIKFSTDLEQELNVQYSNICYINLN